MSDLSPTQVAEQTGLSRSLIYRLIEQGDLPAYRIGGRLRVEARELEAFKDRQRVKPRRPAKAYEPPMRPTPRGDSFAGQLKAIRGGRAA